MSHDPLSAQYVAALQRVGDDPVVLETRVIEMTVIIAALQLALRHPLFPQDSTAVVAPFVQHVIEQMRAKDLVIAEVLERGNDPQHDVPTRRRPRP
jgi:hypothetical protein